MAVSIGSGIGSSWGSASEVTWGTWLTPTKWVEHDSFTLEWKPKRINGKGLANGLLVQRNSQRQQTTSTVTGDLKAPVYYKGMGQYLGLVFGSLGAAPAQIGGTAAYLQTHNYGSVAGQSLSVQAGIPDISAGTIHQYNFNGLKCEQAVFECGVDEYLMMTLTLDGHGYDTSNVYASPTYQTSNPVFAFNQATFKMGSVGAESVIEGVRKVTLTFKRPLKKDNFYQDGTGLKQQQPQNGFSEIMLTIDSDYWTDSGFVSQFNSDTAQSLIWDFPTGVAAGGANNYDIQFKIPNLRWDGEGPKVAGPDIVQPKMTLTGLYDDSHLVASALYTSTDTAL